MGVGLRAAMDLVTTTDPVWARRAVTPLSFEQSPANGKLPPVLPMVLYNGKPLKRPEASDQNAGTHTGPMHCRSRRH